MVAKEDLAMKDETEMKARLRYKEDIEGEGVEHTTFLSCDHVTANDKAETERLRRLTRHKTLVIHYGYKEYMAHHYAYMMKVASTRELESFTEASQDAK